MRRNACVQRIFIEWKGCISDRLEKYGIWGSFTFLLMLRSVNPHVTLSQAFM